LGAIEQTTAKPWILDSRVDTVCFIATPLLIVPLFALAQTRLSVVEISIAVAALGSTGHHLPGLIRAYGDRALFRRFRHRFILAPILLLVFCIGLANSDMQALLSIVVLWGAWHGMAQVYGILRIYDVRAGSTAPLTASLDRWMCIAWFGAGLLFSDARMASLLTTLYEAGLPLLPASRIHAFQSIWGLGTAAVTLTFFANLIAQWRRGAPISPLKISLMITSFGFWWYAMVAVGNAILGIALFEVFHDVQYLAITWIFNRKRVEADPSMGAFSRFLFRPGGLRIALYVGLAAGYGFAIHMVGRLGTEVVDAEFFRRALVSVVAASALLHFYYDGFIWKLREQSTRSGLGLAGGRGDRSGPVHRGIGHALKWALLVAPALGLLVAQHGGAVPILEQRRSVTAAFPSTDTHLWYGIALLDHQQLDRASEELRIALALEPNSTSIIDLAVAFFNLGNAHFRRGQIAQAVELYREAIALAPDRADFRAQLERARATQEKSR
jgi:hypothetical protein